MSLTRARSAAVHVALSYKLLGRPKEVGGLNGSLQQPYLYAHFTSHKMLYRDWFLFFTVSQGKITHNSSAIKS